MVAIPIRELAPAKAAPVAMRVAKKQIDVIDPVAAAKIIISNGSQEYVQKLARILTIWHAESDDGLTHL